MEFIEHFLTGLVAILAYEGTGAARSRVTQWYRERWCRAIGYAARDALMQGMEDAGMPTCARPASKRGKVVTVEILGGSSIRHYYIDMANPERTAADVNYAVGCEERGERGN
ncbi:MAG: hypothetical protein E6R03_14115 [Hyphomicrobiaceae bacterium]|nr:MAG: hypothetical protein E6R03_14115 [Hyphomicrobiaceae bacterium]